MKARVMATAVVLLIVGLSGLAQGQPLAGFTFDDGTALDVSGNGFDGLLLGDADQAAQIVEDPNRGFVLELNGRGMQVDGPFPIRDAFTLSAWIRIDQPRSGRVFSGGPWTLRTDNQGSSEHTWIEVRYPGGNFLDKFKTASEENADGQLDGEWHHYAFVLQDTGEFTVYFDGVAAEARDGSTRVHDFNGVDTIFFGTQDAQFGNALQGAMDDIRLYDYAVGAEDVPELMGSLLAHYTFDDGTAADVSGNGHNGLLLGDGDVAATVAEDPLQGQVFQVNGRGMQVDGPFDVGSELTLAAWIKIDQPRSGRAFSGGPWTFRTDNQGSSEHLWIEVRYPGMNFLDKFNTVTPGNPAGQLDGQWHHYAFVLKETGEFTTYFDGVAAEARDGSTRVHDFNGLETVFFGTQDDAFGNALQGSMDDIRLYNAPLTAKQVLLLTGYQGAMNPEPADGAMDVSDTAALLAWDGVKDAPGFAKLRYVLYLDADKAAVSNATLEDPGALLVAAEDVPIDVEAPDDRATHTLDVALDPNTTYYWRVDTEVLVPDVADANASTVVTINGLVWSFQTEAEVIAPAGPVGPISALEATGNDGDILSINGIPVADLHLGVSAFAGEPAYAGNGPEQGDNFSLATYASADGQDYIETTFSDPVTTLLLIERGANDTGKLFLFDAQDNLVGMPMDFAPTDFADTGYTANGQPVGGMMVRADAPFAKVRIGKPADGDLGIDPICVCGM